MTTSLRAPLEREPQPRAGRARRALHVAWRSLAWLLIGLFFVTGALLLIVRYAVMPRVDELRPRIEQIASRALRAPVTIGRIAASWHGFNPHLVLSEVRVTGAEGNAGLSLPRVEGTVSWFTAVALEPRFSLLRIEAPDLEVVRLPNNRLSVAGFLFEPDAKGQDSGLADWILMQGEIVVRNARIRYSDRRSLEAPASFELANANLQLENVLGSHLLGMQARPTAAVAGPIDLRARFRHSPFAQPSDYTRWTGEVYGSVDYADIAALARLFGAPFRVERAEGAVRSWLTFDRTRITRVVADVALTNVNVTLADDLKPLTLASLQGRLSQRRWGDDNGSGGQEFAASRLTMVNASKTTVPMDVDVRTTRAARGVDARTEVRASRIDLQNLSWLAAHVPFAGALRESLSKHALTGTLTQLAAAWSGASPSSKNLTLKTQFQQLAFPAGPAPQHELALPGFENLNGSVDIADGVGTVRLASKDAVLIVPGILNEPRVKLAKLDATARWKSDPILELRVESLAASNADVDVTASGTYRLAEIGSKGERSGPGWLDLTGRIARLDATSAFKYVPLGAGNTTIEWLQRALVAGKLSDGALRMKGDLAQFPFRSEGQGELRFTARVTDATLDVYPGDVRSERTQDVNKVWPLLTGIDADLLFDRASMTVTAPRASVYGVRLANVVTHVAELGDAATLDVRGSADGPLADMLRYVNASPIARWIGGVTTNASANGNAKLDLRLTLPLNQAGNSRVAGALQFSNNDLLLADVPPFSRVGGTLNFTEAGVNTTGLSVSMLGGQAKIDANTRADGGIVFGVSGMATVPGLRRAMTLGQVHQVLDRSQGQARYSATLTVKSSPELVIESDLVGIAIDGIAPLRKTAQEPMPLRIERTAASAERAGESGERDEIRVTAGRGFAVRLERRLERAEFRLTRGVIAINEAANLPESGLLVLATLPRIDLQAWSTFLGGGAEVEVAAAKPPIAAGADMQIDLVAVRTQELILMGRTFRNVTLGASRNADGGFEANVVSDNVAGYVAWRPEQITARLSRLSIPAAIKGEVVDALRSAPSGLPALDISAEQFELGALKLGRLDLLAQNIGAAAAPAWHVKRFDVSNSDLKLAASAEWAPAAGAAARRIKMRFKLDARDAGATLDRLGFAGAMASGSGALEGEVEWLGSPLDINYPTLTGTLALSLDNGRFLKVETGNAARLLSLLSLQSLSRTLLFDGRSQFADGFAYNSIRADAAVKEGVISTNNFRMAGASAAALMSGTIDLRSETQQLHLVVLPKIDASTAALALGVANPVLGLGAFLASYVLRDPLSKAFALEYDIGGTWTHPVVERRDRTSAKTPVFSEPER